jgi:hypothetical protein
MTDMRDAVAAAMRQISADLDAAVKLKAPVETGGISTAIRKIAHSVPVSVGALLAQGAITEGQAREMGWTPPPPTPRLRRFRQSVSWWWYDHKPQIHLGPCDHSECG